MEMFKKFLIVWNTIMPKPIGNTIILMNIDESILKEILEDLKAFISETDEYYELNYCGNTIKIHKFND